MPRKKIDSQATAKTRRACEAAGASWIGKMLLNVFISYPPLALALLESQRLSSGQIRLHRVGGTRPVSTRVLDPPEAPLVGKTSSGAPGVEDDTVPNLPTPLLRVNEVYCKLSRSNDWGRILQD